MATYVPASSVNFSNTTFQDNQNITSVDLRNIPFVNNSMYGVFHNCENLISVTNINNNITRMSSAFYKCKNLTSVEKIPNSVTTIESCFWGCTNLIDVPAIPNSVTNMIWTFSGCTSLVNVPSIPNSVTTLSHTFHGCSNLVNTPTIPNSVINICNAFWLCTKLSTPPIIPNSVIDASGFIFGCSQFFDENLYPEIPNSVQKLDYMYSSMNNTATDVPQWCLDKWNNCSANVKTSMNGMFRLWSNLINAPVIPNSVIYLTETFQGCTNLVNIPVIPDSVTSMIRTFGGCNSISNLYINSSNVISITSCFDSTSLTKNVYIPYKYVNDEYTTTYNTFINAGYDELGTQHGVYLKDINAPVVVDYEYIALGSGKVDLTKYIGAGGAIVTPLEI